MPKSIEGFERVINVALLLMLAIVVLLATVDLGWLIIRDVLSPPVMLLDVNELLELFGAFLLVLIGLELLNTVKTYITKKTVHVEVVLLVAIVAIARKVVILEPGEMDGLSLLGVAAIILSLSVGYYFVKRSLGKIPSHGNTGLQTQDTPEVTGGGATAVPPPSE